jgi:arylsulfatase A-like enzyme
VSGFPLFERSSHLAGHFTHYDDEFAPHAPLTDAVRQSPLGNLLLRLLRVRWHWREPIERTGDATVAPTLAWLKQRPARPFFLFLHLYDVHGAYIPHQPGQTPSRYYAAASSADRIAVLTDPAERTHLEELYAGEVAFADAQLGKVIALLREQKVLDETLVLLTADHGESLGEHGLFYEHISPYHVETHVPLVLRLPRSEHAGLRITGPAQLQDLPATLRDLLGASLELPGTSLAGALAGGRIPRRLLFTSSMSDFENAWHSVSVRDGRYKLLRSSSAFERYSSHLVDAKEFLFDVASDPGESHDLFATGTLPEGLDLEQLRVALDEFEKVSTATGPDQIDPELAENLHKLGYMK